LRNKIGNSGSYGHTVGSFTEEQAYEKMALDTIFDKLGESEREDEEDIADIIAQKEKLNELDAIEVFKEF